MNATGFPARRLAALTLALTASIAAPACATTYDATLATEPSTASTTTTTLPSGSADELLPILAAEALGLSGLMLAGGDDDDAAVQRIAAIWEAVKAEVNAERPDLLAGFSANVSLTARAVRFRRAADADKAAKNIDVLVDAYLSA